MIRAALQIWITVILLVAVAGCLFGPQERRDIIAMANQQMEEWNDAFKDGRCTKEELDAAMARLENVVIAASGEDRAASWVDLAGDIGLIILGNQARKDSGTVKAGRQIVRVLKKRVTRSGKPTKAHG